LHAHYGQYFGVDEVLFEGGSDHQRLVIFNNASLGRVMALDGVIQITEADEHIYSEIISHVPLFAHPAPRRVLIIGFGDGTVQSEVLKHRQLEQVVSVEIDDAVVQLCREYLPRNVGVLDDPRHQLVIADGVAYIEDSGPGFDVIICNSTDPQGPGAVLFTEAFYQACHARLNEGGVLVTQNGVPFLQAEELKNSAERFAPHFADWHFFRAAIPTYVGGDMAFGWAARDHSLRAIAPATLRQRWQAAAISTRYYNPEVHLAAFALPQAWLNVIGKVDNQS
jgi:spermidine synthase